MPNSMEKKIISYILIIAVILIIVVLSQMPFFGQWGKRATSKITEPVQNYLTKGSSWVSGSIVPTISGEVQKRGEMIKNEVNQEKQKVSENILQKVGNYFSGITNSIVHPGSPQNCQPTTSTKTQTSP